eukprot:742199-Amphidinium_carterae.1
MTTALQAFTAIRLRDSPKEYKQLFSTATVATDPPKGSPTQVTKVALGPQVDSFNLDLKEFGASSMEYLWYSVLTEEQFTTYSQQDGHMPLQGYGGLADAIQKHWRLHSTVRHAVARFQHSKWNMKAAGLGDSDGACLLIWRQTPKELSKVAARKQVTAKVHFWRSEDLSIELMPNEGSDTNSMDFKSMLGRT